MSSERSNLKHIICVLIALVGISTSGVSLGADEETQGKSERYTEAGLMTADGLNLVQLSFVHRRNNFYGYTSVGLPFLLDYGLGYSSETDGSGLNFRIGLNFVVLIPNYSITLNHRLSPSDSLEVGLGHMFLIGLGDGLYPVLSYRHQW